MTQQEVQQLKMALVATATYYNHTLSDTVLAMMAGDLQDLEYNAVAGALKELRLDPKTTRFPMPAQIRAKLNPEINDDAKAQNITGLVLKAVSKCGWAQPSEAREMMGPVGWEIVQRYGGWQYVCENLGDDISVTTFAAQVREGIKAQLQISSSGKIGSHLLDYNQPKQISSMQSASEVLKTIMPKKES